MYLSSGVMCTESLSYSMAIFSIFGCVIIEILSLRGSLSIIPFTNSLFLLPRVSVMKVVCGFPLLSSEEPLAVAPAVGKRPFHIAIILLVIS